MAMTRRSMYFWWQVMVRILLLLWHRAEDLNYSLTKCGSLLTLQSVRNSPILIRHSSDFPMSISDRNKEYDFVGILYLLTKFSTKLFTAIKWLTFLCWLLWEYQSARPNSTFFLSEVFVYSCWANKYEILLPSWMSQNLAMIVEDLLYLQSGQYLLLYHAENKEWYIRYWSWVRLPDDRHPYAG